MNTIQFSPEVEKVLQKEQILIVEPSVPFGQALVNNLVQANVPLENITYVREFKEAIDAIRVKKPKILITEYSVGKTNGISLIPFQMQNYDENTKIAALITHDTTSTTIAEAAEEHVDAYILKPFSIGHFGARLNKAIEAKLAISPFEQKIRTGKALLKANNAKGAMSEFQEATKLKDKSPIAHYYIGQSLYMMNAITEATSEYRKGLEINPYHYKCLLGEFDSYFDQADYASAYGVAKRICKYFPISPKRLGDIFISLVYSNNLEDVAIYYQMYRGLEFRPPELTKIYGAALITAGKYHLKKNQIVKAHDCFLMGVSVMGPDVPYLETIIREFLKARAPEYAKKYLLLFPGEEVGKGNYARAGFAIDLLLGRDRDEIIEKGKKLVANGFADSEAYKVFVKYLVDVNKHVLAEDYAERAIKDFPKVRDEIYAILSPKTSVDT